MASYDFDSDCPLLFKGINYFLWQETMQLYVKDKDLALREIMINGPIAIDKFDDEYTEDSNNNNNTSQWDLAYIGSWEI